MYIFLEIQFTKTEWKIKKQSEQKNTEIKYVIKSFPIKKTPGYEFFTTKVYKTSKN